MKAIILARVSTEEQMSEGQSIPAQLEKAREYVKRKQLSVHSEHQFEESSIKDNRRKLEIVISEIRRSRECVALIVETVDRLQRSFNEIAELDKLRKNGKLELHFIRENLIITSQSNSSEMQRWYLAVFVASSYVMQISDNVKRSIEHKLKNGEYPGKAPFGYLNYVDDKEKNWIKPDPESAHVVVKIYEWYAYNKLSMLEIKKKVKSEIGIDMPKSKVAHILDNPFYYGIIRYGKRTKTINNRKYYPHKYEPIITKDLWMTVQEVKASHKKKPKTNTTKIDYAYRGILTCAKDGHALTPDRTIKKNGAEYRYYRCTQYSGKHKKLKHWREEDLTDMFHEALTRDIFINNDVLTDLKIELKKDLDRKKANYKKTYLTASKEYETITKKLEKLLEAFLDGIISEEIFKTGQAELTKRRDTAKEVLDNLHDYDDDYYKQVNNIFELANTLPDIFKSSKCSIKRQILNMVLSNCTADDVSISPTYTYSLEILANCGDRTEWLPR